MAQKIIPNLWFSRNAKEAVEYYVNIFPDGKIRNETYYPETGLPDFQQEFAGKLLTIEFEIMGQRFIAINAGDEFTFNESVSFLINCKDQKEIDYYWDKLTQDGGVESVCGWVKDKYGLSWQIFPEDFDAKYANNPEAFQKMMGMKKIIIAEF